MQPVSFRVRRRAVLPIALWNTSRDAAELSFGLLRVVRKGVFAPREGEGIVGDLPVETIRSAIRMRDRKTGGSGLADYVARNSSKSRLNVTRIASTGRDRMGR